MAVNDMNQANGSAVVDEIREAGGRAEFYSGSVTDSANIQQIVQDIVARFGQLDILVNNAGVLRDALSAKLTEEDWDTVIDIHLKGSWLCARAALEQMKVQGNGRIINTSSVSALGN